MCWRPARLNSRLSFVFFSPGDHLSAQLPQILSLLMDKLKNEITRTPTLKALAAIATSPLRVDLSKYLGRRLSHHFHHID